MTAIRRPWTWPDRAYRQLLRCYPRAFRERFGDEMVELFRSRRTAAAGHGVVAGLRFWCVTMADLGRAVVVTRRASVSSRGGRNVPRATTLVDLTDALRFVRRRPALTATVLLLLTLTIGAATAMFGVVNAVLLRPLAYPGADRLVAIWEARPDRNITRNVVSGHEFPVWRERARTFDDMAAMIFGASTLTGAGDPAALSAVRVSASFFDVMGIEPVIGRRFTADEDRPGRGDVLVLNHHLWRDRFAGDPAVVGRQVLIDGRPVTVVGVMGAGFEFPRNPFGRATDFWMPIAEPIYRYRGRHYLHVVGRLRGDATVDRAQADMDRVARELTDELPELNRGHHVRVVPLHDDLVREARPALWLLFGAVCCLVAIGVANVTGLLLARGLSRRHEIAVRTALGAGRWRIARQLLSESLVLAAGGGVLGLLAAWWTVTTAPALIPSALLSLDAVPIDGAVIAFALGVTLLTGVMLSLATVFQAGWGNSARALASGGRTTVAAGPPRLRRLLVVAQVALTVVLVLSAGLLVRGFVALQHVDPGFTITGVLAVDVGLPGARYADAARQRQFAMSAIERVSAIPGVLDVAMANAAPLSPARSTIGIDVEGHPAPPGQESVARYRVVSAGYFQTLGIDVVNGREFLAADARRAIPLIRWHPQQPVPPMADAPQPPPVAVINQAMADQFWPGDDPVGRRFSVLLSPPVTVIGVVANTRTASLTDPAVAEFYLHDLQEPQGNISVIVRAREPALDLTRAVQTTIWNLDPDLAIASARTIEDMAEEALIVPRFTSALVGSFGAAAMVLMVVGLYGLMAFTTSTRLPEMGLRLALGARPIEVVRLILIQGLTLATLGAAIGAIGAFFLAGLLDTQLYGVTPGDPLTWTLVGAIVLMTATLACWWPARRAGRIDLAGVLRRDGA